MRSNSSFGTWSSRGFADALGNNKMPVLDLAGNYDKVSRWAAASIQPDFDTFGLQICNFIVENISLPPEVEAAIDKRSSMGVIGNMQAYTQYQTANSIRDAAKNPGGLAGAGAGLAAGYQMAAQMGQAFSAGGAAAAPPPVPQPAGFFIVDQRRAIRTAGSGGSFRQGGRGAAHAADAGMETGNGRLDAGGIRRGTGADFRRGATAGA